jgi:hypothetical protein
MDNIDKIGKTIAEYVQYDDSPAPTIYKIKIAGKYIKFHRKSSWNSLGAAKNACHCHLFYTTKHLISILQDDSLKYKEKEVIQELFKRGFIEFVKVK